MKRIISAILFLALFAAMLAWISACSQTGKRRISMNAQEQNPTKARLLELMKQEILLSYEMAESPLDICSSKIGGKPAVPSDFVWPEYSGTVYGDDESRLRPLSFMAQINLKDVAHLDEENLLPKSGVLSFFYEPETMVCGFEPEDKGAARVFYFPDETELSAAACPDSISDVMLPEFAVNFTRQISLPCYESFDENDEYDFDDYEEWAAELGYEFDEMGDRTKLLGYPDVIQSPMEEECETVTRGYRLGTSQDYAKIPEAEKADIKEKSREWMLLFQIGTISGEEFELMFGDFGHIYFWIKKEDLLKRNFDDIWLVLQCG